MHERGSILEFGPFRLDLLRRSLERDGQPIALSGKALEILAILLERRGEVVDKNDLMRQVWPDTTVEENNITVAISRNHFGPSRFCRSRFWIRMGRTSTWALDWPTP